MYLWESTWKKIKNIPSGAQGESYIVARKSDDKTFYFLKQLKDINSTERRTRFFVETVILQNANIVGIPKIIETNANQYIEKNLQLYYISEYIIGTRLDAYITRNSISEEEILDIFKQLLLILRDCHKIGIYHRDIKPENIIIQDDGKLFLVDFGVSFYGELELDLTNIGSEVGNRFLRLPEYSAGSKAKRSAESDLTLACGIALYMITHNYPRVLCNENGCFPHQTEVAISAIKSLNNKLLWNLLFDKAFQMKLSARWNTAEEILEILDMESESSSTNTLIDMINKYANSIDMDSLKKMENGLTNIYNEVRNSIYLVLSILNGFRHEEQWTVYHVGDLEKTGQIRVYHIMSNNHVIINIITKMLGEQLIGLINFGGINIELLRVPIDFNVQDINKEFLCEKVKNLLVVELQKIL